MGFDTARRRVLPAVAGVLLLLLVVWLWLAPAESRLGQIVKLVYVHGALVWTGLAAFSVAGVLGLGALVANYAADLVTGRAGGGGQAAPWYRATAAAAQAALGIWVVYALSSMAVTGLTWGQWIAWGEPRVRATVSILAAAIVVVVVARLVGDRDFQALGAVVMAVVPWVLVSRAEAIRHPVDPIGGSGSAAIQGYYLLIVLTIAALAAILIAWLWMGMELKQKRTEAGGDSDQDHYGG
ncbi:MAG: hypothetical protein JXA93_16130 [Anaerolineae bacterium]|nr:hypothetical protein [Anaerolineae bacterium]